MKDINEQREHLAENYPTLRDQFAMSVMNGLISATGKQDYALLARSAYRMADAMLTEREKQ